MLPSFDSIFSHSNSQTSACFMVRCSCSSSTFLMEREYSALSAWARREWTAGPFDTFNIFDWIKVLSIFFPISPPRASNSRTKCPLEDPPTLGLHGISAILSTLTVKITVSSPSLAQARAASHPACPAPTTQTSTFSLISLTFFSSIPKSYRCNLLFQNLLTTYPYD